MNKKKDIVYILLLACMVVMMVLALSLIVYTKGKVYGSDGDWLSQHYTFANYIRENFYETKSLFPDFTMNLGAGQSFTQLIYYGLLRPEIILSFLFPFINMKTYLMISSISLMLLSVELFYYWMRKEGISSTSAFIASILFACSGPLLFHTHRHIMFMNYMPWVILSFIGIRRYILKNKSDVMLIGIVLMIFASYFFSVSGIVMCGVYAIYSIVRYTESITLKSFSMKLLKCCLHIGLGVGIAAVLLVPTILSMLGDHRSALEKPTLQQLFNPEFNFNALFIYREGAYSVGLTAIVLVGILYSLYVKKLENRLLSCMIIILSIIPFFCYILNGMQYIRAKSLIPMLPLAAFLIAFMIDNIPKKKDPRFLAVLPLLFIPYFFMQTTKLKHLYFIDLCIIAVLMSLFIVKRWKALMLMYLVVPAYMLMTLNKDENYVKMKDWKKYNDSEKYKMISSTLDKDAGFYRFDDQDYAWRTVNQVPDLRMNKTSSYSSNYNVLYNTFFYNLMRMPSLNPTNTNMLTSQNPFFQGIMGVKYMYTNASVPYGYHAIENIGKKKIIENENVFPIAYATSNLMSEKDFSKVQYPYNLDTIYNRAIISGSTTKTYKSQIYEANLNYSIEHKDKFLQIEKVKDGYRIKTNKKAKINLKLDTPLKDEVVIIRFPIRDVKNGKNKDTRITINGVTNMLSKTGYLYKNDRFDFDYFLSSNKSLDKLTLEFSKGEYTIKNPKLYLMSGSVLNQQVSTIDKMNYENKKGSVIAGTINVKEKGYFITSLPYQKGFIVKVDGKAQSYEKVNTAFVGFPIEAGKHTVEITYKTPGKRIGIILSIVSLLIAAILFIKGLRKGKIYQNEKCSY